jgi:YtkA-like
MKRRLLAIALGITFLILITWIGTIITSVVPHHATAQVQTAQAGPYQVTLQVNPNPPPITQPATLSIQIREHNSKRPVSSAKVTLESNMVTMDMGTGQVAAKSQHDGTYLASVQFSMSGPWQVQVVISMPGESQTFNATFDVSAQ